MNQIKEEDRNDSRMKGAGKKSQRLEQYIQKVEGGWNQQLKGWVIDWSPALDKSLEICYNLEEDAHNEIKHQYSTGPQKIWVDYLLVWFLLCLVKNFTCNF